MKAYRRPMLALVLLAAAVAAGYFGLEFARDVKFAYAEEKVQATRQQLAQVENLASVFRQVAKAVEPSVVQINVTKSTGERGRARLPFDPDTLRRFFRDRDGDGEGDLPEGFGDDGGFFVQGTGSGVILEAADGVGYLVTNNHVAGGATEMTIILADGRKITNGKVVGADPKTDLAVVKFEADRLISAKWGDSDQLQKGDWIMAFGSPFGYVGSMTHGIVSALNRDRVGILGPGGYENFIQVDAPINPGNSGGPLVNIRGEVVGINTAIASRTGGFQGIGFAIPSNQAKFVFGALKDKGKVTRGWLGIGIRSVGDATKEARSFGYEANTGVLVDQIFPNTPATGKLVEGDIITHLDGKPMDDATHLRNSVAAATPGQEVTMTVFREGKSREVKIKLGEQPEDLTAMARGRGGRGGAIPHTNADALGLRLGDITPEFAERFGLRDGQTGALVMAVEPRSVAAKAGIRPGDLITRVAGKAVKDADEARDALGKADLKAGVRLYVVSRDVSRFVFVQVDK